MSGRLPVMEPVRCKDCARADNDAKVLSVPAGLRFEVVEINDLAPTDYVHACGQCRRCGKVWCVKTLRPAA